VRSICRSICEGDPAEGGGSRRHVVTETAAHYYVNEWAGAIRVENGITYDRDGEVVKRFGFHNLGRHSLATFLMHEQENPAVVQAIMRHAKMDMTLYYSHSSRKAKRAAQEKMLRHLIPEEMRVQVQVQKTIQ
jgi:integrase